MYHKHTPHLQLNLAPWPQKIILNQITIVKHQGIAKTNLNQDKSIYALPFHPHFPLIHLQSKHVRNN